VRSIEVEVRLELGLHARPAAAFVRTAAGYDSVIRIENMTLGLPPADAKSIVSVLTTGVERGHLVRIIADGPDDGRAVQALRDYLAGVESVAPIAPVATPGGERAPG
jgi:phosphotransferase system HPr (HPr) family protein